MRTPNTVTPSQLGLELGCLIDEQAWYLIQSDVLEETLEDVRDTLTGVERRYEVLPAANAKALLRGDPSAAACLPTGTESWADSDYADLDRLRAAVRAAWPVLIWIASPRAIERLVHLAPNFASFFQPSIGIWWNKGLTPEEAEVHLRELRARWGQSDEEVIALAATGQLQQDVDHHLWLILLGRGDLIDHPPTDTT